MVVRAHLSTLRASQYSKPCAAVDGTSKCYQRLTRSVSQHSKPCAAVGGRGGGWASPGEPGVAAVGGVRGCGGAMAHAGWARQAQAGAAADGCRERQRV